MNWGASYGGGTALGAVQPGAARRIETEHGCKPSVLVGVSVGSLLAAMHGEGRLDDNEAIWQNDVKSTRFFQAPNADVWNGIFHFKPLRRELARHRIGYELECDVYVGVVDLGAGRYRNIHLNPLSIADRHDAIICSCTQPLIHEDSSVKGRMCDDGGVAHLVGPIPQWKTLDAQHAIFCSPVGKNRVRKRTQKELARGGRRSAALEVMYSRIVAQDVRRLRRQAKAVPTFLYAPESWEAVGDPFDAKQDTIHRRLRLGPALYDNRERL